MERESRILQKAVELKRAPKLNQQDPVLIRDLGKGFYDLLIKEHPYGSLINGPSGLGCKIPTEAGHIGVYISVDSYPLEEKFIDLTKFHIWVEGIGGDLVMQYNHAVLVSQVAPEICGNYKNIIDASDEDLKDYLDLIKDINQPGTIFEPDEVVGGG